MSTGSDPAYQLMVSRSWLLTSAIMPLEVRMSVAHAGGRPGPWVSDLIIIGSPTSPLRSSSAPATKSRSKRRMKPSCSAMPAASAAALIAAHSTRVIAIGFSRCTCSPSRIAVRASGWWVKVVITTPTFTHHPLERLLQGGAHQGDAVVGGQPGTELAARVADRRHLCSVPDVLGDAPGVEPTDASRADHAQPLRRHQMISPVPCCSDSADSVR